MPDEDAKCHGIARCVVSRKTKSLEENARVCPQAIDSFTVQKEEFLTYVARLLKKNHIVVS